MHKYIILAFSYLVSIKGYGEDILPLLNNEKYQLIKEKYDNYNYGCLTKIDPSSTLIVDLNTVIDYTLCNNPDISEAWSLTKKQIEQIYLVKSSYMPKINLIGESNTGSIDYKAYENPGSNYNSKSIYSSINIEAKWLFYDFGLKNNSVNQAKFMFIALSESQNSLVQKKFLEASTLYFDVIRLQGEFALSKEAESLAQQSYFIAEKKYHAGVGLFSDMLQAKTTLAKANSDKIRAEGNLLASKGDLAESMGYDVSKPFEINTSSMRNHDYQLVLSSVDSLIQQANKIHPELLGAQAEVLAAEENLLATKKENLPKLYLTSNFQSYRQQGNSFININQNSAIIGIKVEVPIFNGLEHKHKLRVAQLDLDIKNSKLRQIQRSINIKVWKSYYNLRTESNNLNVIEELQNSASTLYQIALQRYKSGVGNMLELIDAQKSLADAKQQKNAASSRWNIARVELLSSVGLLK